MGQEGRAGSERRDPQRIRAEIEQTRAEIAESMLALRDEIARRTDWRAFVRRRPLVAVGVAFYVGYLLGKR